jgi:hypothetical protein
MMYSDRKNTNITTTEASTTFVYLVKLFIYKCNKITIIRLKLLPTNTYDTLAAFFALSGRLAPRNCPTLIFVDTPKITLQTIYNNVIYDKTEIKCTNSE